MMCVCCPPRPRLQVDAELAALEAAAESQRRCIRQLQAPIMHLRQQRAARRADTAAAATDRQLFHAQLLVQPAAAATASATQPTQLSRACIATANVAALPAFAAASAVASTSAVTGWTARAVPSAASDSSAGTGPAALHVLLSNQSGESAEVDPQWTRLAVQLRVRPLAGAGTGGIGGSSGCHAATISETELQSSFPAARWAPRSSFQTSLPIDSALLAHAHANVRVLLRIRRPEYARASIADADITSGESKQPAGSYALRGRFFASCPTVRPFFPLSACVRVLVLPGFVDVVLGEWTLDALDLCSPVLPLAAPAPVSSKRKRADGDNGVEGAAEGDQSLPKHARPGGINQQHRQALLGEEARLVTLPQVQLFGR